MRQLTPIFFSTLEITVRIPVAASIVQCVR